MTYIMDREELYQTEGKGLSQKFRHRLISKARSRDSEIMYLVEHGMLDETDIRIARFLYENRMADQNQLAKMYADSCGARPLPSRLHFMVQNRIINTFGIASCDDPEFIPADALHIYTFDYAGMTLLSHYYDDLDIWNWNCRSQHLPVRYINRLLITTDFHIALLQNHVVSEEDWNAFPLITFGRFHLVPQAAFAMKSDGAEIPVLSLTAVSADCGICHDGTRFADMMGRYEEWFAANAWKDYCETAPLVSIICDTGRTMRYVQNFMKNIRIHEYESDPENRRKTLVRFSDQIRITHQYLLEHDFDHCMFHMDEESQRWMMPEVPAEHPADRWY